MGDLRKTIVVVSVLAITAALGIVGVGARRAAEEARGHDLNTVETEQGVAVKVVRPSLTDSTPTLSTRGFLIPFEEITLSAEVPGLVAAQFVEVSDRVNAGDPLFEIDNTLHKTALSKAMSDADRAGSDLELADDNRRRMEKLNAGNSAEPTEVFQARVEHDKAKAMTAYADAVVAEARIRLAKALIASPLAGVVARIQTRRGEYAHVGQPLADVIEIDRLRLVIELDDREVVAFAPGDPVTLVVPALPGEGFSGRVLRVHPRAAADSHRFEVEIEIPNKNGRLRPGFYVEATLGQHKARRVESALDRPNLILPRIAILEQHRKQYCFVVRAAEGETVERVHRTELETTPLLSDPQHVRIVAGVTVTDRVVTTGLQQLKDRDIVRVVE